MLKQLLYALAALIEEVLTQPGLRAQLAVAPAQAAKIIVTFTRGLAVMERIYDDRETLLEAADALAASLVLRQA